MYKYQKELIDNIDETVNKLSTLTDERYYIKIGTATFKDKRETLGDARVYAVINGRANFNIDFGFEEFGDDYCSSVMQDENKYRFKFDENIFIKFNEIIDKIFRDNKERKEFYEKLNREFEALNNTLNE